MWNFRVILTTLFIFSAFPNIYGYIEALAGSVGSDVTPSKVEPQVAVVCNVRNPLHPQYMDTTGRWVTDFQTKNPCLRDKIEILELCRKAYRGRNITNIVEAPRSLKIDNWCKIGHRKCKTSQNVKPYRCLEGAFQSEALLVPEQCVFDHIHNASRCWTYDRWNATAANACAVRELKLRSFAILLPCGVDMFSGVEFVCCPKTPNVDVTSSPAIKKSFKTSSADGTVDDSDSAEDTDDEDVDDDNDDDDDDDEDDDDIEGKDSKKKNTFDDDNDDDYNEDDENEVDSDEDDDTSSSVGTTTTTTTTTTTATTTTTTTKPSPTPDPYLTHYNPKKERDDFLDAEQRLEERHRERVGKIMKDWSELEDRYQEMHSTDPKGAEEFKRKMTNRFKKLVKAMEDEDVAEKRQLSAVHQQRVLAAINEKKRDAMTCYTEALNENPANTRRIQKCLEKLLRALHKDRHHNIAHFRHLLNINPGQAQREKDATLHNLNEIDRLTNQSLQMLERYPDIQAKVVPLMKDYLMALRSKDDTPSTLLVAPRPSEEDILDSFKAEVAAKQADKERQRQADKLRKEDERRRDERKKMELKNKKLNQLDTNTEDSKFDARKDDLPKVEIEMTMTSTQKPKLSVGERNKSKLKEDITKKEKSKEKTIKEELPPYVDAQAVQHLQDRPKVAHAQTHQIVHNEPMFSVRHETYHRENRSVYFTLAFAGLALLAAMVVGIVLLKRRHARSPHQQGFIEVDQAVTPEERHVANMQINGYENPTYKYFEAKE